LGRLWSKLEAHGSLIKSKQTLLLLATGLAGYLSARPESGTSLGARLMTLALFSAVSGTTALNMVFDRDIDARMVRTARRPLPSGTLSAREAARFGGVLVAAGLALAFWLSRPFGWVIAAGVGLDLCVYTLWLKRRTPWSIVFGGVSGGMPILAGRTLGTGGVDGLGLLLALSVLLWIPAHILTFAMKHADDYRLGGVPTWPAVHGFDSTRRFIAVSNALRAVSLVAAGWWLGICPWSLSLLAVSGVVTVCLSVRAVLRPSAQLNLLLFKLASLHMLASMVLLTLGAVF
ncbi:MAG TPA: UbiA family prenyltransferase, partial [Anaerolineae bacterium]|nr:UbiA family prenyltransferase [Anaerolineae bacterium]